MVLKRVTPFLQGMVGPSSLAVSCRLSFQKDRMGRQNVARLRGPEMEPLPR